MKHNQYLVLFIMRLIQIIQLRKAGVKLPSSKWFAILQSQVEQLHALNFYESVIITVISNIAELKQRTPFKVILLLQVRLMN